MVQQFKLHQNSSRPISRVWESENVHSFHVILQPQTELKLFRSNLKDEL